MLRIPAILAYPEGADPADHTINPGPGRNWAWAHQEAAANLVKVFVVSLR